MRGDKIGKILFKKEKGGENLGVYQQIECPVRKDRVWIDGDVCKETNCNNKSCHYHWENHNHKKENPWQEKIVFRRR